MTDWKLKLAAWLHDPAEKALILMRTREGHEYGTAKRLREELGIDYETFDKRADWLAAAADRPQWPRPTDERYSRWANVKFGMDPVLIHPLSGEEIELQPIAADIETEGVKAASIDHFQKLIVESDARLTFLAFWRFGPELGRWAKELGALWNILPADTRVPDHSIWTHLDMVSAIHTTLAEGDKPALLAMSFGPVQGFISQARSTSDLWAGSHLLSTLVWEGIKTIAENLGPDSVIFPSLRGMPAADMWLIDDSAGGEQFRALFKELPNSILEDKDDTNPLFAAALPNKFVALVPSKRAKELAEQAILAARKRALDIASEAALKIFEEADVVISDETRSQITSQVASFPEAFWAAATWPMNKDVRDLAEPAALLQEALSSIHVNLSKTGCFDPQTWEVLTRSLKIEGFEFWQPNAGIVYPAVYELAERALASAKTLRPFEQLAQEGHRCTQCGEREWLTDQREFLQRNRTDRKGVSVWGKLAAKRRSWAKDGEHLCALCSAKRLWPTLFARDLGKTIGSQVNRFVVSTHALAISTSVEIWLKDPGQRIEAANSLAKLERALDAADLESATLPKRLVGSLHGQPAMLKVARKLPSIFEDFPDADASEDRIQGTDFSKQRLVDLTKELFDRPLEAYYAVIEMDGDRMGAWLAGNEDEYRLHYRETWHPQTRAEVDKFAEIDPNLKKYIETARPPSPARHAAISRALGDFSVHLARHIVEDCAKGKLLYAGGDDVLALVAVDDLFDVMQLLRLAYSGLAPHENMRLGDRVGELRAGGSSRQRGLLLNNGFGLLDDRLMILMGHKATASMGAIVAHHTAPLSMVLRQLREAESQAKRLRRKSDSGRTVDRDAFCIRVLKRAGGAVAVTSPWWQVKDGRPSVHQGALTLMKKLRDELADTGFSRGAIYHAQMWAVGLTDEPGDAKDDRWREQMAGTLAAQFHRQNGNPQTARDVVNFVCDVIQPNRPKTVIGDFLATCEFAARESRTSGARP